MAEQMIGCDHIIRVDWLRQCILIFHDLEDARRELAPYCGTVDAGTGGAGYAVNEIDGSGLFWMIFPGGKPALGTVIHEAIHIVDYLCEFTGIPVSVEASEVRCYMAEWLVGCVAPLYGMEAASG